MTRFARAKGSKSSNERVPEEATPWREIKQQLVKKNNEVVESKKRQAALNQRNANYKAFLDEKEDEVRKKTQWAEFPSENSNRKIIENNQDETDDDEHDETFLDLKAKVDKVLTKLDDKRSADDDSDAAPDEHSSKIQPSEPKMKIKKPKKKKLAIVVKTENKYEESKQKEKIPEEKNKSKKRKLKEEVSNQPKLKKTKNDINKKIAKEDLSEKDLKMIEKKKQKRIKQLEKKKKMKEELKKQKELEPKTENENNKPNLDKATKNNKEKFKQRDNKEHTRRKPFLPTKMFINGKEVDVDYVDGFPVKKEDAVRLKKLRKEMISKGLPRSEINISLKLERRKAEKAFTREKKKVCFNCRKSGHNLSECPELDKGQLTSQSGVGICFKCGSTEHTHYECKVVRGQEYKYAQCFICNEQGHISRQCPDNARGLYPKGGACRVCGDVTHLKKDCPKYQAQQLQIQNSLSIETIGESNPDVLDDKNQFNNSSLGNGRSNKIIKF